MLNYNSIYYTVIWLHIWVNSISKHVSLVTCILMWIHDEVLVSSLHVVVILVTVVVGGEFTMLEICLVSKQNIMCLGIWYNTTCVDFVFLCGEPKYSCIEIHCQTPTSVTYFSRPNSSRNTCFDVRLSNYETVFLFENYLQVLVIISSVLPYFVGYIISQIIHNRHDMRVVLVFTFENIIYDCMLYQRSLQVNWYNVYVSILSVCLSVPLPSSEPCHAIEGDLEAIIFSLLCKYESRLIKSPVCLCVLH
jgi:hypothetical protein